MAKRQHRRSAQLIQTRTRTRQNRGTSLVGDPAQNTQELNDQLRALGLYAAPTLGDGNCLFRALSDQYYGSPSKHLKLREDICNWMKVHKERYAPFVDDERGLKVHLKCMREPGTYGGHLELTAFAHLMRRDVKVIQPGLVYVIEWQSGADLSPIATESPLSEFSSESQERPLSNRDARQLQREKKREIRERRKLPKQVQRSNDVSDNGNEDDHPLGAIYVAYHDWEHFSSVRNLTGPHSGLPSVVEKPASPQAGSQRVSSKAKGKMALLPQSNSASSESFSSTDNAVESDEDDALPKNIPLPLSRSTSPPLSSEGSTSISSTISAIPLPGYNCPADSARENTDLRMLSLRINRSPKRSYDAAGQMAEDSQGEAKRSRSGRSHDTSQTEAQEATEIEIDNDVDADTPDLLSSAESSSASSSFAATPPPSMVVIPPSPVVSDRPLTRRQRKALGLPKPRPARAPVRVASAGKIIVPGGRYKKPEAPDSDADAKEWMKNGRGRLDVRGFRELKI